MDWEELFADRVEAIGVSDLDGLFALIEKPEVISFAAGVPCASSYPIDRIKEVVDHTFATDIVQALGYGADRGWSPLREWVAEHVGTVEGLSAGKDNILITSGSLHAFDLISKILISPGDTVLVEEPSYLAAIQTLRSYQAQIVSVPMDDGGVDVGRMEGILNVLKRSRIKPKFFYTISSFQNPTGITLSGERRPRLAELLRSHRVVLVEDNTYGELYFEGEPLPSVSSYMPEGAIYMGTFSKIFAPGVRLGWAVAHPQVIDKMAIGMQCTDQCPNSFTQRIVYEYARRGWIGEQVSRATKIYKRKRDLMLKALKKHLPSEADWTVPRGGFFLWVRLPKDVDTYTMFKPAVEEELVAYAAGSSFYPDRRRTSELRLAYSQVQPELIEEGISRLGRAIEKHRTRPSP